MKNIIFCLNLDKNLSDWIDFILTQKGRVYADLGFLMISKRTHSEKDEQGNERRRRFIMAWLNLIKTNMNMGF